MDDVIGRLNAALEGRYAVEQEIGQGGMALVFLAQDIKHNRKVALKVLRSELSIILGGDRFLKEIEVTANLQHPNILPLYDSGEADGFLYYVMPLMENETLADRLERERQLPLEDALEIAKDVSAAVDYAHRQGLIHRDIKPSNILLHDGQALVADFGIALAMSKAGRETRLTETGLSVGTPHYMSPEQAAGDRELDARSDLYSLGAVVFEMLVGEPPHVANTAQAVVAKILTDTPAPISRARELVPANVEAAVAKALARSPADRFASVADFSAALTNPSFTLPTMTMAAGVGGGKSGRAWKVTAGLLGLSTVALAFSSVLRGPEETHGVLRYELMLPVEVGANTDFGSNVAISPDGQRIVYSGMPEGAVAPGLWLRDRALLEPVEIPGTSLGVHPTFSPDGTQVAFIGDDRTLKVVSLGGRPPVTLYGGPNLRRGGLSWADDGFIYFAEWVQDGGPAPLHRIPETGGEVERVTSVDSSRLEVAHYFPDVLPGSELVLFAAAREEQYAVDTRDIAVANIETGEVKILLQGIQAVWSETGHILAVRGDGALISAEFDPETLEVGPAVPAFEGVQIESLVSADISVSSNGTLIFVPGTSLDEVSRRAVWVDRDGGITLIDPDWSGRYADPRLSPGGSRVAVSWIDGNETHVWVKELDAGPQSKLTFQGRLNIRPVWTPDGTEVAFISNRGGNRDVFLRRADAAIPAEGVLDVDGPVQEIEFTPDGEWMVVRVAGDIYLQGTEPGSELVPLIADSTATEMNFTVSPDGRWIAYVSDETGQLMVYVRPFPNVDDGKWPVSLRSGTSPRWAPDGSELFYRTSDAQFMAAEITSGPTLIVGERRVMFPYRGMVANNSHAQYDVHPDGERFFMIQLGDPTMTSNVVVIENFSQELTGGLEH